MRISIHFEISITVGRSHQKPAAANSISPLSAETTSNGVQTRRPTFGESAEQLITAMQSQVQPSTIDNYQTVRRSFLRFLNTDIALDSIDGNMLQSYQRWLRDRGLCLNTISCYMRSLRALLSKSQIVGAEVCSTIFKHVYTGQARTEKRALTEQTIERLRAMKLKPKTFLAFVRDIFLFSFYAQGMPPVDVAFLRKDQIRDDSITYYRRKTGQRVTLRVEPCMKQIIDRYHRHDSPYLFPILTEEKPEAAYRQYQQWLNRYNRNLKRLAAEAGITERLTAYAARHTWASEAYSIGVELPVISKGLGHTNPNTTLIYLREINNQRLEKANRLILSQLTTNGKNSKKKCAASMQSVSV